MIFSRRLHSEGHIRAFVVREAGGQGWEVREEEDDRVIKHALMQDWHRVESVMVRFSLEAVQLQRAGWVEVAAP